uniref:Uncharacterized protein n=1 Tax=Amphimedon queenslandica TaxID=400682 RepID=A0A1X7TDH3_AMPQE
DQQNIFTFDMGSPWLLAWWWKVFYKTDRLNFGDFSDLLLTTYLKGYLLNLFSLQQKFNVSMCAYGKLSRRYRELNIIHIGGSYMCERWTKSLQEEI